MVERDDGPLLLGRQVDPLRQVEERAGQSVQPRHYDGLCLALRQQSQCSLESGPVVIASGVAVVLDDLHEFPPAPLALCLNGLVLGVEREAVPCLFGGTDPDVADHLHDARTFMNVIWSRRFLA